MTIQGGLMTVGDISLVPHFTSPCVGWKVGVVVVVCKVTEDGTKTLMRGVISLDC